jgi:hypothetical protein
MYTCISVQDGLFNFNYNFIFSVIHVYMLPRLEYYVLLVVASEDAKEPTYAPPSANM